MIDVLFLVLLFRLLTTTIRVATFLRVTLPEAAVGKRPIALDHLARMLAAIRERRGRLRPHVRA